MRTIIQILIFTLMSSYALHAQQTLYYSSGTSMEGRIVDIEGGEEGQIKTLMQGNKPYTSDRKRLLMVFNNVGNYLVIKNISEDASQAKKQVENFYSEKGNATNNDVLFKGIPQEVIPCKISAVLDEVVNYQTLDGKPASIKKDELLAIIFRDGKHLILKDFEEVVDNLSEMYSDFARLRSSKKQETVQNTNIPQKQINSIENLPSSPKPVVKERKELTTEEQKIAKAKSKDKIEDLRILLNDIIDNNRSRDEKNKAIEKAVKMFTKDATVEVASINNPNIKNKRTVKEYLERLSRLKYSSVSITYADVNFVQDFALDENGNYWGMATYSQVFEAGSMKDITKKNQKVKLQPYSKIVEGTILEKYEVLLGDIQVEVKQ